MFENTLTLVEECGLTHFHVFPYSARPGTPAANMPQVDGAVVAARAKRLRQAGDAALRRHLAAQVGKKLTLLSERGGTARAEDFTKVRIGDVPAGRLISAEIVAQDGKMLVGQPANLTYVQGQPSWSGDPRPAALAMPTR